MLISANFTHISFPPAPEASSLHNPFILPSQSIPIFTLSSPCPSALRMMMMAKSANVASRERNSSQTPQFFLMTTWNAKGADTLSVSMTDHHRLFNPPHRYFPFPLLLLPLQLSLFPIMPPPCGMSSPTKIISTSRTTSSPSAVLLSQFWMDTSGHSSRPFRWQRSRQQMDSPFIPPMLIMRVSM